MEIFLLNNNCKYLVTLIQGGDELSIPVMQEGLSIFKKVLIVNIQLGG